MHIFGVSDGKSWTNPVACLSSAFAGGCNHVKKSGQLRRQLELIAEALPLATNSARRAPRARRACDAAHDALAA